ncbi:hypothetical protein EWB00_011390 [Schistosoma japonicum]|uniref:Uncharacterized protein n=1 Tax=Schistosoma japonicum TaxID=6182 RepID=A0A4Z2DKN8_SCHJA|nr:hypothetical protein KSF78_0007929 [Schistosoma japonicum]KAH8873171.1 hypothetical protein KSF78_0007929 [Schistosoma japonicum]TNN17029.1 hypothetical protein EWB00_011390 [Schistosoma japonicum]
MTVMKQRLKIDPKLFLAKIKPNRKKAFSIVEKLAKHPLLFKQFAKEFSTTATDLISILKSTDDHTVYLNSLTEIEPIIFSLNVMLKSSGVRHILVEKELFASLKQLHQSLDSISPPFSDTVLRELSVQYQNQVQHNSNESNSNQVEILNDHEKVTTDQNENNRQLLPDNVNIVNTPEYNSSTERSKRKSLKRSRKLSSNEEFVTCK